MLPPLPSDWRLTLPLGAKFFPYPFLDIDFYFHLENLSNNIIALNGIVRGIEPETNNHEKNYQTTRPAKDELPKSDSNPW